MVVAMFYNMNNYTYDDFDKDWREHNNNTHKNTHHSRNTHSTGFLRTFTNLKNIASPEKLTN
jgi:hypothetical protein